MSRAEMIGAAKLCRNSIFREFLTDITGRAVPDAEAAAKEVRAACNVVSRREFETVPAAAQRWRELVERFNRWGRAHGQT